jgi:hypothetical protein
VSRKKKLLGLTAVGVSVFGLATAYLRKNNTPAPTNRTNVQVSPASNVSSPSQPRNIEVRRVPQNRSL